MRAIPACLVGALALAPVAFATPAPEPAFVDPFLVDSLALGLWEANAGGGELAIEDGALRATVPAHTAVRMLRAVAPDPEGVVLEADVRLLRETGIASFGIVLLGETDALLLTLGFAAFCSSWTALDGTWRSACAEERAAVGEPYELRVAVRASGVEAQAVSPAGEVLASFAPPDASLRAGDVARVGYFGHAWGGAPGEFESEGVSFLPASVARAP